jgi:hypothetical protein
VVSHGREFKWRRELSAKNVSYPQLLWITLWMKGANSGASRKNLASLLNRSFLRQFEN